MIKRTRLTQLLTVFVAITAVTMVSLSSDTFAQTDRATDVSPEIERLHDLKFKGETSGWAIVGSQAHPASLTLDGKATHAGNGVWVAKSDSEFSIGEREAQVHLKGKVTDHNLRLSGTGTLSDGTEFKIFLRGHFAPIADSEGDFAMVFKTAILTTSTADERIRIPLALVGQVETEQVRPVVADDISQEIDKLVKDIGG